MLYLLAGGRGMVKLSVREFAHDLAGYLRKANAGEKIVVTLRNQPLVDITRHQPETKDQGWKRPIHRIKLKGRGPSASEILLQARREARY
jgi:antitoxin (DNA-binding transcriptional repressor) of toxin-antitoxin stability system